MLSHPVIIPAPSVAIAPEPPLDPTTDPAAALVELAAALIEERPPPRPIAASFAAAVEGWLEGPATLEQALGLGGAPGIAKARTRYRLRRRDAAIRRAYALMEERTPWRRSLSLANEIRKFQRAIWPAWRDRREPPSDASTLRRHLFEAHKFGPVPPSARRLCEICAGY